MSAWPCPALPKRPSLPSFPGNTLPTLLDPKPGCAHSTLILSQVSLWVFGFAGGLKRQLWLFNSHPLGGWDAASGLITTGSLSPGVCPGLCSTIICPFLRMFCLTLVATPSLCFSCCGCRVRLGVAHMGCFPKRHRGSRLAFPRIVGWRQVHRWLHILTAIPHVSP